MKSGLSRHNSMLFNYLTKIKGSLSYKIIILLAVLLTIFVVLLFSVNINNYKKVVLENAALEADRLSDAIKLGTNHAMMLDSKGDIKKIITNISKLEDVKSITIFNKKGRAVFSNHNSRVDQVVGKTDPVCIVCHEEDPPKSKLALNERVTVITDTDSERVMRIVSPIPNESTCATPACHVHSRDETVLGLLVMTISLDKVSSSIASLIKKNTLYFLAASLIIFTCLYGVIYRIIYQPIRKMIDGTKRIGAGDISSPIKIKHNDELGQLAHAINTMGREVHEKHTQLNEQRKSYQMLFEGVPCLITVQDKNYKLIGYNKTFSDKFSVKEGAHCYEAYKNRTEKCPECPVEKTFMDGKSHTTEEVGFYKDGTVAHWIVNTAPVLDSDGNVVAAMEMCLDITSRKTLEEELKRSERKYHEIFNNIPNVVFVLDAETLEILDCNRNMSKVYGYIKGEVIGSSFLDLFADDEDKSEHEQAMRKGWSISRAKHITKKGRAFFVSINISGSEYHERQVLLATTMDITERIKSEEQLIQASKMATLGEMATGVAHELNQPLAVLQMVSNLFQRKIKKNGDFDRDTLLSMAEKMKNNVERASKIINHMREFGRKSNLKTVEVNLNQVIRRSFDLFSQQLKLRNIEVVWELEENLPLIMADPNRLEQVFINLLINARDAIEDKCSRQDCTKDDLKIILKTRSKRRTVTAEVIDSGPGIPKGHLTKLFEPFFTTKEVGKGTGLGLSISYGIVTDYKGTIRAQCPKDSGAKFVVTFPRK